MTISTFFTSFALSWALLQTLARHCFRREKCLVWLIVVFEGIVLLTLTISIPFILVNYFDEQLRAMTELYTITFYYVGLFCWLIFVFPQVLILIHELRKKD